MNQSEDGGKPDEVTPVFGYPCSDDGNAGRFVEQFEGQVLWTPGRGWLIWDGKRFDEAKKDEVLQLARLTARSIQLEAAEAPDKVAAEFLQKFGTRSENGPRLREMLAVARGDKRIACSDALLDTHPELLNTPSGVVDLATGKLRPHDPALRLTKMTTVPYHPEASAPTFEKLLRATLVDGATFDAFQRFVGYAATGHVREEVLGIAEGPGGSFKNSSIETTASVLGDYARRAPIKLLISTAHSGSIPNEQAIVVEARLAFCDETPPGGHFNEQHLKMLTGSRVVPVRRMRREWVDQPISAKIILTANDLPWLSNVDEALRRRLLIFQFTNAVSEAQRDPTLKDRLLAEEGEGILAWVVAGARAYLASGLRISDAMRTRRDAYLAQHDVLSVFIDDELIVGKEHVVAHGPLYVAYRRWCEDHGRKERALPENIFGEQLERRGFKAVRFGNQRTRGRRGLALRPEHPFAKMPEAAAAKRFPPRRVRPARRAPRVDRT